MPTLTARRLDRDGPELDAERWKHIPQDLRGAHAHVMEELVDIVHERWGSWNGYADAVGIDESLVTRLRDELVETDAP